MLVPTLYLCLLLLSEIERDFLFPTFEDVTLFYLPYGIVRYGTVPFGPKNKKSFQIILCRSYGMYCIITYVCVKELAHLNSTDCHLRYVRYGFVQ